MSRMDSKFMLTKFARKYKKRDGQKIVTDNINSRTESQKLAVSHGHRIDHPE